MSAEPEKPLEQIRAEFEAAVSKSPVFPIADFSGEGKVFLDQALQGHPHVPGRAVREGKIQDGEFD